MILASGVQVQHKTGRTELWGCCVRPSDTLWYRQVLELVLPPSPSPDFVSLPLSLPLLPSNSLPLVVSTPVDPGGIPHPQNFS